MVSKIRKNPSPAGPKPTPAAEGTPAPAPPDQIAFLNKFANDTIEYNNCTFDPTTLVVDCESRGRYAVNPPLTGQDIVCRVGSVNGTPRLINCTSQEPLQAIYYEIPS